MQTLTKNQVEKLLSTFHRTKTSEIDYFIDSEGLTLSDGQDLTNISVKLVKSKTYCGSIPVDMATSTLFYHSEGKLKIAVDDESLVIKSSSSTLEILHAKVGEAAEQIGMRKIIHSVFIEKALVIDTLRMIVGNTLEPDTEVYINCSDDYLIYTVENLNRMVQLKTTPTHKPSLEGTFIIHIDYLDAIIGMFASKVDMIELFMTDRGEVFLRMVEPEGYSAIQLVRAEYVDIPYMSVWEMPQEYARLEYFPYHHPQVEVVAIREGEVSYISEGSQATIDVNVEMVGADELLFRYNDIEHLIEYSTAEVNIGYKDGDIYVETEDVIYIYPRTITL